MLLSDQTKKKKGWVIKICLKRNAALPEASHVFSSSIMKLHKWTMCQPCNQT